MSIDFTKLEKHLDVPSRREHLLEIESTLKDWPFPPQLVVETTSYCNIRCIHCSYKEMTRQKAHMSQALWERIIDEVAREMPDCEVWPTFYGEALMLKGVLWEWLRYADRAGCTNLVLNSNGTLLNRWGNIDHVLESPLKRFIISLDGLSRETFEHVRAKAKWDDVYPAVEALCRRRLERGIRYPAIIVQFSVMRENAHEVEAFRSYWHERGAEVKVRPMLEWATIGSVRTETIRHDTPFRIACPWGNNTMAILQDGTVSHCAVDFQGANSVGLIGETLTIKEAWKRLGEKVRRPHREHRWDDIPELCKPCGDWQTVGAEYEPVSLEHTRPFWFDETGAEKHA